MEPPCGVGSFSPANNNMCDQNQVPSTLDGLTQDLQPLSPMQQTQQPQQSASQSQQTSQSQLNDMPNMVDTIGVPLPPNIIDPYNRRPGNLFIQKKNKTYDNIPIFCN